ncbi:hypothetical protein BHM04_08115 [Macrococcus sp. IME1552]|nr:hypothetical protein [Macrococcus sp. IME1552]ATD31155.1 hypothetical protein BHM04_08115 [Macrococcus sp. IME1552]
MKGLNIELLTRLERLDKENSELLIPYLNGINNCVSMLEKRKEVKKLDTKIAKVIQEQGDKYDF